VKSPSSSSVLRIVSFLFQLSSCTDRAQYHPLYATQVSGRGGRVLATFGVKISVLYLQFILCIISPSNLFGDGDKVRRLRPRVSKEY
jgi:hypothetical protein